MNFTAAQRPPIRARSDSSNHNQFTRARQLSKKIAALGVPCIGFVRRPMPRPFTIRQHHAAANEARCRFCRQDNLLSRSTLPANSATLSARHGALSLKKYPPHTGTFLDTALACRLGHKTRPSMCRATTVLPCTLQKTPSPHPHLAPPPLPTSPETLSLSASLLSPHTRQ